MLRKTPAVVCRSFASKAKAGGSNGLQEKLVALCRHRGFVFPGSEIYGGLANSFDYGPLGASCGSPWLCTGLVD